MTNEEAAAAKAKLRVAALERRQSLSPEIHADAKCLFATRGLPVPNTPTSVVAGYWPIHGEIDPRPLLAMLAGQGATTALPSIAGQNAPLIFRAWREGAPVQRGALGISEPLPEADSVQPTIVLVPLSAFDRRGQRIGYGAGHYDRALGLLRLHTHIVAIGLAFATQEIDEVPAEPHDVALDFVLTEREIIDFRSI
ncbi:5-formyltetrahydrofolate cyclo-ligase [Tardiphaga sp. vice304]|uniref:5-formyltetrahydrofolate cyclo-ligase n=1 Tax=Tardiphaga sp. vice304 TaxID=2592817 RepID=UPI0011650849|nr:5-formyltetrahydrofolate cyclo-ligase [Tardiphaga sp. vice304]QDM28640.1 5-formyltetrahydrofolate cyclo-ligase [Tardiphaga sp. vice304]